jgi:hypothetical protein
MAAPGSTGQTAQPNADTITVTAELRAREGTNLLTDPNALQSGFDAINDEWAELAGFGARITNPQVAALARQFKEQYAADAGWTTGTAASGSATSPSDAYLPGFDRRTSIDYGEVMAEKTNLQQWWRDYGSQSPKYTSAQYQNDLVNIDKVLTNIQAWDAQADREVGKLIFAGLIAPAAAAAIPVIAAAAAGTAGGGLAYGATYFGTGGTLNATFGAWRSYATGEAITTGGVVSDFATGGVNLSFLRISKLAPVNDLFTGALSGFGASVIKQRIDTGNVVYGRALADAAEQGVANMVAGRAIDATIAGVNSDRGNWGATFDATRTRILNGNASNMSLGVAFRGALAHQYSNLYRDLSAAYVDMTFVH